jgi:hypothetical protein
MVAFAMGAVTVPVGLTACAESGAIAVYGGPPPDLVEPAVDAGRAPVKPGAVPPVKPDAGR